MNTWGVTVGKFMPFHEGHRMMIDFGAAVLDYVTVIVSGTNDDQIPVDARYYRLIKHYRTNPRVNVVKHYDNIPECEQDHNGTATEQWFWDRWTQVFKQAAPRATHFVSSDQYGQIAASNLGIQWLPTERWNGLHATTIRRDPIAHYHNIVDTFKSLYTVTVAIVGPESCGKSTLVDDLARHYDGTPVHEYGRTISEVKSNQLTCDDFFSIMRGQQFLIDHAMYNDRYVFSDTEAFTTYLFGQVYMGVDLKDIKMYAEDQEFDLYVLLKPTLAWEDDGSRVVADQGQRQWFFDCTQAFLEQCNKNYVVIDPTDPDYLEQTWAAVQTAQNG